VTFADEGFEACRIHAGATLPRCRMWRGTNPADSTPARNRTGGCLTDAVWRRRETCTAAPAAMMRAMKGGSVP